MERIEQLRQTFPDAARDIKLNLQAVLNDSILDADQKWGVALASAIATGNAELRAATLADARSNASAAAIEDAVAAAAVMGMNNVYYRFRHMIGKDSYSQRPPRLRMNRLAQPQTSKATFELISLAVSAINGCEMCVQSHERSVLSHGLSEDHVHEAARIAATFAGAAAALDGRDGA